MLEHPQGAAGRQAAIATLAVALVAAATAYCAARPYDPGTLAIEAAELRSQAAEGAMAARLLRTDSITPGFARLHAGQLARSVDDVAGQLHVHPAGELGAEHTQAEDIATALASSLRQHPQSRDARNEAALRALSARANAIRKRLKPTD